MPHNPFSVTFIFLESAPIPCQPVLLKQLQTTWSLSTTFCYNRPVYLIYLKCKSHKEEVFSIINKAVRWSKETWSTRQAHQMRKHILARYLCGFHHPASSDCWRKKKTKPCCHPCDITAYRQSAGEESKPGKSYISNTLFQLCEFAVFLRPPPNP